MYNANLQLTSSKMYQIIILYKLLNIYQYMELYSHKISTCTALLTILRQPLYMCIIDIQFATLGSVVFTSLKSALKTRLSR